MLLSFLRSQYFRLKEYVMTSFTHTSKTFLPYTLYIYFLFQAFLLLDVLLTLERVKILITHLFLTRHKICHLLSPH